MKIVKEEIFGPVVVMSSFETEDEVIDLANDSIYGLASAVFTQDVNRCLRVSTKLKVSQASVFSSLRKAERQRDNGEAARSQRCHRCTR